MKTYLVLLLIFTQSVFSQNTLSENQISSLYKLGKKWGAYKYFFSQKDSVKLNVDSLLLSNIDKILNKDEIGNLYLFDDSIIIGFKTKKNSKYVTFSPVGNAIFSSDKQYSDLDFPNTPQLRLLALFRLWNAIEYFAPNKDLAIPSWDSVLKINIPIFYSIYDLKKYNYALMEMLGCLQDGHAIPFCKERNDFFGNVFPFIIKYIEGKAIVAEIYDKKLCKRAGIKIGDEVISVNNENQITKMQNNLKYISFTNTVSKHNIALNNVAYSEKKVALKYYSNSNKDTVNTQLKLIGLLKNEFTTLRKYLKNKIGLSTYNDVLYFDLIHCNKKEINYFVLNAKRYDKLILDLRGYPNTFVIDKIVNTLFTEPAVVAQFKKPSTATVGCFESFYDTITPINKTNSFNGKIVLLVDETTLSEGEYTTMMFQALAKNITTIGEYTAGADGNVNFVFLPGKVRAMFTGLKVLYPNGEETQNKGVKINYHIANDKIKNILDKKDVQLEYAIDFLKK